MKIAFQPKVSKWSIAVAAIVGGLIWAIATEYVSEMRGRIVIFLIGVGHKLLSVPAELFLRERKHASSGSGGEWLK